MSGRARPTCLAALRSAVPGEVGDGAASPPEGEPPDGHGQGEGVTTTPARMFRQTAFSSIESSGEPFTKQMRSAHRL